MDKYYSVNNEDYLLALIANKSYKDKQKEIVFDFLGKNDIEAKFISVYLKDTLYNIVIDTNNKDKVELYINDSLYDKKVEKHLKKVKNGMRGFRKNSILLKQFQEICAKENMIVNIPDDVERKFFENLDDAYVADRTGTDDNYYLHIMSDSNFHPNIDGFIEITKPVYEKAIKNG